MTTPLSYLSASGGQARTILPLTWFTLGVSIFVCVAIGVCLWLALRRARQRPWPLDMRSVPVERGGSGLRWIGIGLALSAVPLLVTLVWTMVALAGAQTPNQTAMTLDVTPHQWWWEVRYDSPRPNETFSTANEIHIPVGEAVRVRLHGADVIHSFWIPQLSGKTDAIPGQTNVTWLQAQQSGRYEGQCTEYCGMQHAHMALEVVAESPDAFAAWRANQLQPAQPPATATLQSGKEVVEYRCGLCHKVRGTRAAAVSAPDLTHVGSRRWLAAGTVPNDPGHLAAWILAPQSFKPGTLMPPQQLQGQQLADVVAYMATLR